MIVLLYFIFFMIGTIIGSYTNMLAYRYVNVKPIWSKSRSYCPNCNKTLKWYSLFPIFSYLFQKGKCTYCKEKIHPRYFILELFAGLLFMTVMHNVAVTPDNLIFFFVLLMFLVPILVIDVMIHIIYDGYIKFLIIVTAVFLYVNEHIYTFNIAIDLPTFKEGIIHLLVIYIGFLVFNKVGGLLVYGDFRVDLIGGGDVKLIAWMFMLMTTYSELIVFIFVSSCIALVLFGAYQLLFSQYYVKRKGILDIPFSLVDAKTGKENKLKVKISEMINPSLYAKFTKNKILPFTFILQKIEEDKNLVTLHNGKVVFSIEVDKKTMEKIKKDKSEHSIVDGTDVYIICNLIFDEDNQLVNFEYDKLGDYELYFQSMLRTKTFGSEGIPFAPGLIFGFLTMLLWGHDILLFVRNLLIS